MYHNHCITKWLVNFPYNTFVLEDLSNIRKQRKGKKINNWLSNWTFHQLELLLTYKAATFGKKVVKVDPSYTSQTCFACGKIEQRYKSHYMCSCGYQEHADINAAKNISRKYLSAVETTQKAEQAEWLASLKNETSVVSTCPIGQVSSKAAECIRRDVKPTAKAVGYFTLKCAIKL